MAELTRIGHLLKDLLEQARCPAEVPNDLALATLVEELLTLVRYQAPPGVAIRSKVAANLHCVLPDGQLRQAILNLVLNAIHALEGRSGEIQVVAEHGDGWLRLCVADDGPGYPAEVLAGPPQALRTGRSSGTGLGLTMVRRFAHDLGGHLELSNHDPQGACATMIIPCPARQ